MNPQAYVRLALMNSCSLCKEQGSDDITHAPMTHSPQSENESRVGVTAEMCLFLLVASQWICEGINLSYVAGRVRRHSEKEEATQRHMGQVQKD